MAAPSEDQAVRERHERAVATWERFDEEVPDEVLRAVSGAFAIVACADGRLEESEISAFIDMIKDTRAFHAVDLRELETQFRRIGRAILDDFEEGRQHAFHEIALLERGDPRQTALVVSAAQIAIVSNGKLDDAEEVVLGQICEALGLDPAAY
ncbi:tellurite resistance TerB family protein [Haliangium sp.]|uniref:tellurite resistance TerB family protein n=1 Tax=Haliangium sp. TaxID=2663208 RepID=UPI003D0DBB95